MDGCRDAVALLDACALGGLTPMRVDIIKWAPLHLHESLHEACHTVARSKWKHCPTILAIFSQHGFEPSTFLPRVAQKTRAEGGSRVFGGLECLDQYHGGLMVTLLDCNRDRL
jgi:hypothetical protein